MKIRKFNYAALAASLHTLNAAPVTVEGKRYPPKTLFFSDISWERGYDDLGQYFEIRATVHEPPMTLYLLTYNATVWPDWLEFTAEKTMNAFYGLAEERVKRLEIERPPNDLFLDGYPTKLLIDGKYLPHRDPPMWERTITLLVEPDYLGVRAELKDRDPIVFIPEEFNFVYGCVQVLKHPKFCPCRITVGQENLAVVRLWINFVEGEMPTVGMTFKPVSKPYDWEPGD